VSISIVVANDHPIVRSGLRSLLERESDFRVVGEAANAKEAIILARYKQPSVLIMDVNAPALNGMTVSREIASSDPQIGIIFVTTHILPSYVEEAFKAGARGYVAADSVQTDLSSAIRSVASGSSFISPSIAEQAASPYRSA
jgi:DNA-binding NarL/FixJ family response regulator